MKSLSALCLRRLGFDPASLSPDQLQQALPDIVEAVLDEFCQTSQSLAVVQKSAAMRAASTIPNLGIVRDEYVPLGESQPADLDPNGVFDSLFPNVEGS